MSPSSPFIKQKNWAETDNIIIDIRQSDGLCRCKTRLCVRECDARDKWTKSSSRSSGWAGERAKEQTGGRHDEEDILGLN